jgi:hypothetical protein
MKNKSLLYILVIFITGIVLLAIGIVVGILLLNNNVSKPLINQATPTTVQATAGTSAPIPADIANQMDKIQQQVTSYRGLQLNSPFNRQLLTTAQLKVNVVNDFFKDYTPQDAARDSKVLAGFGLLQPGFDLQKFYVDLYSEQVAGYYDEKTKSMYVISDEAFGGTERSTYAHEFTHTLQDQNFDIENGLKITTEHCKADSEYCAAVSALMEGDATLSEQYWLANYSTQLDKQQIQQFQQTYKSPVYDSAPEYMKQDFLFPYSQGADFAYALYSKNQWQGIDDAFKNPPVSTEQILHPQKYPSDKPIPVTMPDFTSTLGSGWSEIDRNVMGEWYTSLILDAGIKTGIRLDVTSAQTAAAGWGGDTYVYYTDKDLNEQAMVWNSLWETDQDTNEFWQASLSYAAKRWGKAAANSDTSSTWTNTDVGMVTMKLSGRNVLWMFSPDETVQSALLAKLGPFGS